MNHLDRAPDGKRETHGQETRVAPLVTATANRPTSSATNRSARLLTNRFARLATNRLARPPIPPPPPRPVPSPFSPPSSFRWNSGKPGFSGYPPTQDALVAAVTPQCRKA